jgi:hypothetical protein
LAACRTGLGQRSAEQLFDGDDAVPVIDEDDHERLSLLAGPEMQAKG